MWKVLIADDEPKIRRGLRSVVEARVPDTQIVGEAEDGEAALALASRERPDIMLVDINMPLLNGLEFIERIQAVNSDCSIIVVTGHDEFDYAKKALQLRVFDYLLKPVDQEHLAHVMLKAQGELAASRRRDRYFEWAREQLERNMTVLREQFARQWIRGALDESEISEQMVFFGISPDRVGGIILVHNLELSAAIETMNARERHLLHYALRRIVEEAVYRLEPILIFEDEHENILAITHGSGGEEWLGAAERIRSSATRSVVRSIMVEQTRIEGGVQEVPDAYEALLSIVTGRGASAPIVVRARGILDSEYCRTDLGLGEVASTLGLSPDYLSRVLKQQTGFSFIEFLTRIRLNRALQLLNDPAAKLYEVAEMVGFSSQHYFSRAFKRVLGTSPVDYRRSGVR